VEANELTHSLKTIYFPFLNPHVNPPRFKRVDSYATVKVA